MQSERLLAAEWSNALTLSERAASLGTGSARSATLRSVRGQSDVQPALRRLERWRSQSPFSNGPYFAQRLAADGLTEEDFFHLLGESAEAVKNSMPGQPAWLKEFRAAYSDPQSFTAFTTDDAKGGEGAVGMLRVIEPLIRQAGRRLRNEVRRLSRKHDNLPFNADSVVPLMFEHLAEELLNMLSRTMVLELHVASQKGLLEGETAAERFLSFLRHVCTNDAAIALFQEYPVLARQLVVRLDRWVESSLEFLRRLCADWPIIRRSFSPEHTPGHLLSVEARGDKHRGGRSVLVTTFDSNFRLVYKPKSLAVDVHFQQLLDWMNRRGAEHPFRTLKIIDRGDYGWVEFVAAEGCRTPEEVERFYLRQGAYLALLYAVNAVDLHYENVIAVGEHPLLIDLEGLFQPRIAAAIEDADALARIAVSNSVLSVGLLPLPMSTGDASISVGVDLSGLGATTGQATPFATPRWDGAATDQMRLVRNASTMGNVTNQPTLNGAEVDVTEYADAIAEGFTRTYRLLMRHRTELLADDGPLSAFTADEVRVIARPTRVYGRLLQESFHPDLLRNALDRDRLFDRLWVETARRPHLEKLFVFERDGLLQGDVPLFTTRPNSHFLSTTSQEPIAGLIDESGMTFVRRRVARLSEHDLARQLWLAETSLAAVSTGKQPLAGYGLNGVPQAGSTDGIPKTAVSTTTFYSPTQPQVAADRAQILKVAEAVGRRLETLALRDRDGVVWIGLNRTAAGRCSMVPTGFDLYDGLPGIALFLGHLGRITGKERFTDLARSALATLRRELHYGRDRIASIGGFDGWGGLIYMLSRMSQLWNEPHLLSEADTAVEMLPPLIESDEHLDVISGAAGCLASLIELYRCRPSQRTLDAARQCGDRLLSTARPMKVGSGWTTRVGAQKPLAGFSHGAAGMAWSLLRLAALADEPRYRSAALAAMDYERSLYDQEAGNWPDLRTVEFEGARTVSGHKRFITAWCHGAPGIGLARLDSLAHVDDAAVRAEIDAAVKATLRFGFGDNHSLCHGDLGNLDFLLRASRTQGNGRLLSEVERLAAAIVQSIDRNGWLPDKRIRSQAAADVLSESAVRTSRGRPKPPFWRCGTPEQLESPGLMTGIAGIGYGLLRLLEPETVPSVLTLASSPREAAAANVERRPTLSEPRRLPSAVSLSGGKPRKSRTEDQNSPFSIGDSNGSGEQQYSAVHGPISPAAAEREV